jgi:RNA polymerase sigma factor (sigma-70 family)
VIGGSGVLHGMDAATSEPTTVGRRQAEIVARRRQAALDLLAVAEGALRRSARRYSLCADDADDAFQRAVEILLTKAPEIDPNALAAWMQVVTRREALAVRRSRERLLGAAATGPEIGPATATAIERSRCESPGPADRFERRERVLEAARLLARLKADERRAVVLQAGGYSYAEIQALTGWTYTKVNRSLAEGRARLRRLEAEAVRATGE